MIDLLFKNVSVVDGTGSKPRLSDVAISGDHILEISPKIEALAKKVIDGKEKILSPGFIDMHGHTDHFFCVDPQSSSKVLQGVTTEVCGNCGYSPFLLTQKFIPHFQPELNQYGLDQNWHDLASFKNAVSQSKPAINWLTLVGHGTLRLACMGYDNRPPRPEELKWMKLELEKAMDQGAIGFSTGLIYTPGCFAEKEELIELGKVVAQKGGFYATHMRSEGDQLLESIEEARLIARTSQIPLQISHLKTAGEKNWNKIGPVLESLEKAQASGEDILWDRYPYAASFTSLDTCLSRDLFDGGDLQAVQRLKDQKIRDPWIHKLNELSPRFASTLIAYLPGKENQQWIGKNLNECALLNKKTIGEFVIDLLVAEKMQVNAIFFSMSEENLDRILSHPSAMLGSDASARSRNGKTFLNTVHPRTYGTFPRFIKKYVIDSKKISLEEAVRKMTGLASQRLKLKKRGFIKRGYYADLVLFDPKTLEDCATFQNSTEDSKGIERVLVNGKTVVEKGRETAQRAGIFLEREA
ncbi:MAG: D-aminoacylase [Chlamydiae bacterium]|nr:D-aminoacylase [Chlamydiota bacterium]MBI3266089.1 D-aminoacylase [Chlamydiota bacterium]